MPVRGRSRLQVVEANSAWLNGPAAESHHLQVAMQCSAHSGSPQAPLRRAKPAYGHRAQPYAIPNLVEEACPHRYAKAARRPFCESWTCTLYADSPCTPLRFGSGRNDSRSRLPRRPSSCSPYTRHTSIPLLGDESRSCGDTVQQSRSGSSAIIEGGSSE
ncbi:hypothetical protein FKP32DRAFT_1595002 [Trametes sanguinea]|nr:hypothetical protein FKP32DRAFT_1595002 [Trametes sanguinea]